MTSRQNDYDSFSIRVKTKIKKTVLISVILSAVQGHSSAYGVDYRDALKLYAHSRILIDSQYQCFHKLITKESNWSVSAKNGSHYGLGQMRNVKYKTLHGYKQIDWTLKYIKGRYQTPCKAWEFHKIKGYY